MEALASMLAAAATTSTTAAAGATAGTAFLAPLVTTVTPAVTGSGILGGLSTALSVGSAISTILGGVAGYQNAQSQSKLASLNADAAMLEAEEKALRIRRELVQKVGAARVAFAGSGLDISSATAIEAGYGREADFETSLALNGGRIRQASGEIQADTYQRRGMASLVEAAAKAGGTLLDNKISIARRG